MLLISERRAPGFIRNLAILLHDEAPCRLVAIEAADQLGGHATVGALRAVFIENVEEHELAFGIGAGFLCHGFLLGCALTS